jgi:hypothetical protein
LSASAARVVLGSLLGLLVSTSGLLADEFALRTRAESRLLALPVALGLFAHGSAHSVGSGTSSTALSRSTDSLALGAISGFAEVLGATNIALRLVAVDLARSAGSLLAVNLALRTFAYGVALSRARGVIALPSALRMASGGGTAFFHFHFTFNFQIHGSNTADQQ